MKMRTHRRRISAGRRPWQAPYVTFNFTLQPGDELKLTFDSAQAELHRLIGLAFTASPGSIRIADVCGWVDPRVVVKAPSAFPM